MKLVSTVLVIYVCIHHAHFISIRDSLSECCIQVTGMCRQVCNMLSLADLSFKEDDNESITSLRKSCSRKGSKFWRCINSTLLELKHVEETRPCCAKATSDSCRLSCLQADSLMDIRQSCRSTVEAKMFSCLDKQDAGEECCKNARTRDCFRACRDNVQRQLSLEQSDEFPVSTNKEISTRELGSGIKRTGYLKYNTFPGQQQQHGLGDLQTCKIRSPHVLKCLENYLLASSNGTHSDIYCCQQSESDECRNSCQETFRKYKDEQELIENLSGGVCGPPLPGDPLWQCFLKNSKPHDGMKMKKRNKVKQLLGMDSAKLHCCHKAKSLTCQQLCLTTFSTDLNKNWEEFNKLCQYDNQEASLLQCLADAEEPCGHGCTDLKFCSNFNYHTTGLFRSCNIQSDRAAERDVYLWKKQRVIRLESMDVPLLDITTCQSESWKALACILHIRPCDKETHTNFICLSDCLQLANKCVDKSRLPFGQTPQSLCNRLSNPDENSTCVPLNLYNDQETKHTRGGIQRGSSYPCSSKENRCNDTEVCLVNERELLGNAARHTCVAGCRLGEISEMKVTRNTYITIPAPPYDIGCNQLCKCSKKGRLERCRALACDAHKNCWYAGKNRAHNSHFMDDCNNCHCFNGHTMCTKSKCPKIVDGQVIIEDQPGFSCSCPKYFSPVCGMNGKTFSNACVARHCFGLSQHQYTYGECYTKNPCHSNNPCTHPSQKCIPKKRICVIKEYCPQYECVVWNKSKRCKAAIDANHVGPVCDVNGDQHANICEMIKSRSKLGYWSKCQKRCDRFSGLVCGVDGETYTSECSARANSVLVDYTGPCLSIGPMTSHSSHRCKNVRCQLSERHPKLGKPCKLVIPPGACCPICGSVLRILINKRKLKLHRDAMRSINFVTTRTFVQRLSLHVKVIDCKLYGHLDIYGDLIVIFVPNSRIGENFTLHQQLCEAEARRISTHLRLHSPVLATDALLSTIVMSLPAETVVISASSRSNQLTCYVVATLVITFTSFLSS